MQHAGTSVNQNALSVTEQQVIQYLAAHPDFLVRHPEVLNDLVPVARDAKDGVLDFQKFQIEQLQRSLANIKSMQNDFFTTARDNLLTQQKIHECVLLALEAECSSDLLDIVLTDWPQQLGLAAISFCLETDHAGNTWFDQELIVNLGSGEVNRLMGSKHNVLLRPLVTADKKIFGGMAPSVRSDAHVRIRLDYSTPPGMLVFGAAQPGSFAPGQSVELIVFLAQVLEANLRLWKFLEN
jgi:uncharacterized protein